MGVVGEQQISALPEGFIGTESVSRKKAPNARILQSSQHDGAVFGLAGGLHPKNIEPDARFVLNLFGQSLGGNPIFRLMAELHKNLGART